MEKNPKLRFHFLHIDTIFTVIHMPRLVAHWLPFSASSATIPLTECDVDGYFVHSDEAATFRGRNLCGMKVDSGDDLSWYVRRVCL
jgi:hypothetical protein